MANYKVNCKLSKLLQTIVTSGTGRGKKFVSLPAYTNIFQKYLPNKPFPGTLNLILNEKDHLIINQLFEKAIIYDDIYDEGKKMGGIKLILLKLGIDQKLLDVIGVRPLLTSHNDSIIEIVSDKNLRNFFKLKDGNSITLNIEL